MTMDKKTWALIGAIVLSAILSFQCSTYKSSISSYQEQEKKYESDIKKLQASNAELSSSSASEIRRVATEYEVKIKSLTKERDSLRKKTYKERIKIVKPDGSIVEKEIEKESSDSTKEVIADVRSEYQSQIKILEDKMRAESSQKITEIKESYEKQLAEERSKSSHKETVHKGETKTERKLRLESGLELDKDFYYHSSYSLSPFVVGGGVSAERWKVKDARLGLGLEF